MTLRELYEAIDGDYEQAAKVLRMDKLIDKHIKKLPGNPIFKELVEAGEAEDSNAIFERAHAIKGLCANLGLTKISDYASKLTEEFRAGAVRTLDDEQVDSLIRKIDRMYRKASEEISRYEATN